MRTIVVEDTSAHARVSVLLRHVNHHRHLVARHGNNIFFQGDRKHSVVLMSSI